MQTLRDKKILAEMLELRKLGWSHNMLAERYGKDRTTIIYHCNKHGIDRGSLVKNKEKTIKQAKAKVQKKPKYAHIIERKMNQGKFYKEYIRDNEKPLSRNI